MASYEQALLWYRAGEDAETSIREGAQMQVGIEHLASTLKSLGEQGYRLQRVRVETLCGECKGSGREHYRPKGMGRKRLPLSFLPMRDCRACNGSPILASV